jgi:parallel beta-helix repeat protein
MNDDIRLERLFDDGLHDIAPTRAPDRLRTQVKTETSRVRPRPRWLAIIKEPPMRTNSHLAVGSPAMRVAVTMAATLLAAVMLVGATFAGAQILAADGPIVVDQSGGGTVTTITEAVAMAEDGDEILVRPGTYAEEVVIESDIKLRGDGPVEEIVIELADAVLIALTDSNAEIANLTLSGGEFTQGMTVAGGAPTISGVVFDGTGRPFNGSPCFSGRENCGGGSLAIDGGEAQVLDSYFIGGGEVSVESGANVLFDGNELIDGPHIYLADAGTDTVVRGNEIIGALSRGIGVSSPGAFLIEDNRISGAARIGIRVGKNSGADGYEPVVMNNTIEGTNIGIEVRRGGAPQIEGNTLSGNRVGIDASNALGTYASNVITVNERGLILSDKSPIIDGNTIRDNEVGLVAHGSETTPVMTGNTICDNETNVALGDTVPPLEYDDSNEICEDAPAE